VRNVAEDDCWSDASATAPPGAVPRVIPRTSTRNMALAIMPRSAIIILILCCSACLDPTGVTEHPPSKSLLVLEENRKVGSPHWDSGLHSGADTVISGYVLPLSVREGDTLNLFVNARAQSVFIEIYRLGWYNGDGARLLARRTAKVVSRQPACSAPRPGPMVCGWTPTLRLVVPSGWVPGVYLATFQDSVGYRRSFPFVVRSDSPARFVVVLPFATYQAYNDWGGTSLYGGPGSTARESYANRAVKVSFARPFGAAVVQDHFLGVDYLLVRWLEENAYDVNYITDYDFHRGVGADARAAAWLFAGHSEYWSWSMWRRANAARAQGINLGFLGGNDIYWLVRFEEEQSNGFEVPVVVCYRDTSRDPFGNAPTLSTVRFRSPPNNTPENSLVGVMTVPATLVLNGPVDLVVANGEDPLMANTGLVTGQHIPRVVGWEGDRIIDNGQTPIGIRVLFESPYTPVGGSGATGLIQATAYVWPASGAIVYASGEPGFAWGLSTYAQYTARRPIQIFLQDVLAAFVRARTNP